MVRVWDSAAVMEPSVRSHPHQLREKERTKNWVCSVLSPSTAPLRLATTVVVVTLSLSWLINGASAQANFGESEVDVLATKCEVCKTAVKILFREVANTDPTKVVSVGSFRLMADGTVDQKKVLYRGSESQLHDLVDEGKICAKMVDYVPVTHEKTGLPSMISMVDDLHRMSQFKFNPNPDFNSKMEPLCNDILGDNDEALLHLFKKTLKHGSIEPDTPYNFGKQFCVEETHLCRPDDTLETLRPVETSKDQKPENKDFKSAGDQPDENELDASDIDGAGSAHEEGWLDSKQRSREDL